MTRTHLIVYVLALWCAVGYAVTQTNQSTYEDHRQIAVALNGQIPAVWAPRGLSTFTIWLQAHISTSPVLFRMVNLQMAFVVALLAGAIAARLGGLGWCAMAVMLLHPLTVETIASISGRRELIAATGTLLAVAGVAWYPAISGYAMAMLAVVGIGVGVSGKESAVIAVALVPAAWWLYRATSRGRAMLVTGCAVGIIAGLCACYRFVGEWAGVQITSTQWTLRQAMAAVRLMVLTIIPWHQTIDYDYEHLPLAGGYLALLILGVCLWGALRIHRERPLVAFGCLWMLLVILPRLIVHTPTSYFNEHEWYGGLIGMGFMADGLLVARA